MSNDEKIFRDRLYHMEATLPDDMWDRISEQLPKRKKRRGFWLFFLIGLMLIGTTAGILSTINSDKPVSSYEKASQVSETLENQQYTSPIIIDTDEINNEENLKNSGIVESIIEATSIDQSSNQLNSGNQINKEVSSNRLKDTHESYTGISNRIKEPVQEIEKESPGSISNDISEEADLQLERERLSIPLFDVTLKGLDDSESYQFSPPECPTFGFHRESGLYVDFLYSHDLPMRSLELKSQELGNYIDARNNTESSLYSFSASMRVSYISGSGLGFKTGFNYSQINEKFEYLDPDASLIRTIITIDTLLVGGVPTVISDTSTIRIPGSLDITTFNRYRFFDIPLLLTYEAPLNDKFYYSFNGGALINLAFSQKGRFLDPSEMPVWFTRGEPDRFDAFRSSAGLSLFGSLGLHYKLNDKFDIILEPNFRFYMGSLTTESYPLEQNWFTFGLSHGIRYKF